MQIASLSKAKSMHSSMSLLPRLLGREMDRMSRTRERYRLFRRVQSRLGRARVPRAASDLLAGAIVGHGFRLRGAEAEFEVNGVKLAAPRRFLSNYIETSYVNARRKRQHP
jgi:hypothetical protein